MKTNYFFVAEMLFVTNVAAAAEIGVEGACHLKQKSLCRPKKNSKSGVFEAPLPAVLCLTPH